MILVQKPVDMVMCDVVTVTPRAPGAWHPECASHPDNPAEFKPATKRGGVRAGAGRKARPASVAVVPPGQDGPRWYVACVDGAHEVRLQQVIREAGWSAVAPQYRDADGFLVVAYRGYILVEFDIRDDCWREIAHLRGVRSLLGGEVERPRPVAMTQAAWVLSQFGDDGVQRRTVDRATLAPLPVGAAVRVAEGLGLGWSGRVVCSDGRSVVLLVDGRRVKVAQGLVALCV